MARMKPFRRALRLGFCPSCHAKRAVVWAEWLATEVLAKVEHRPSLDKLLSGAHGFLRVVGPAFRQPEPTTGNPEHLYGLIGAQLSSDLPLSSDIGQSIRLDPLLATAAPVDGRGQELAS